ncbi:MAG: hemolysin family protein [Anaerovoracaceae bacterium]
MSDAPSLSLIIGIEIIVAAVILFICSLLSAAQKAVYSVNRNIIREMAEDGDIRAKKILLLIDNPSKLLATTFVALTFFGLLLGEMIATSFQFALGDYLNSKNLPYSGQLSILFITLIVSIWFLVFVIFLPRQIAIKHPEKVSLKLIGFVNVCTTILLPFVVIIKFFTNVMLKIVRQGTGIYDESFSEENVMSMLEVGQETGALKEEGKKMINSIFAFDDKLAYEVMTPRTDVFSIDILDETEEYIDELMELRYSRIPVYEDDSDNIIGILNIKDYLIKAREDGFENVDIKSILRDPFLVPETKNIDSLFFELQKTKQHIAILIDEYGGFSGIVTMEDIVEEVMGDIDDEYDEEEHDIEQIGENKYLIDGFMDLDDVNEKLNLNLTSETSETVGGLIIDILGEIPPDDMSEKIIVNYENLEFVVESVKDRRIERVVLIINKLSNLKEDETIDEEKEK